MAKNTIKLVKYTDIQMERAAAAEIYPGMLLEYTSSSTVQAHSTAGGNALPTAFALEDELQGGDIDTAYSADDQVPVWIATRGEHAYAILADDSASVSIGDPLESAGNGYLTKHVSDVESFESAEPGSITVYPQQIVAIALEALDLSGSSGEESSASPLGYNKRIEVLIV
jgi:hypothetical protein